MAALAEMINALETGAPPPLGAEGLAVWENEIGVKLPGPLREILSHRDGGNLSPGFSMAIENPAFAGGLQPVRLGRILGIADHPHGSIKRLNKWLQEIELEISSVPDSLFIFGDDWDGNAITFDSGSQVVGYLNHETVGDDFTDPETYVPVAKSFDAFLDGLKAAE